MNFIHPKVCSVYFCGLSIMLFVLGCFMCFGPHCGQSQKLILKRPVNYVLCRVNVNVRSSNINFRCCIFTRDQIKSKF